MLSSIAQAGCMVHAGSIYPYQGIHNENKTGRIPDYTARRHKHQVDCHSRWQAGRCCWGLISDGACIYRMAPRYFSSCRHSQSLGLRYPIQISEQCGQSIHVVEVSSWTGRGVLGKDTHEHGLPRKPLSTNPSRGEQECKRYLKQANLEAFLVGPWKPDEFVCYTGSSIGSQHWADIRAVRHARNTYYPSFCMYMKELRISCKDNISFSGIKFDISPNSSRKG